MSVLAVARKDFADARRSKALIGLSLTFIVMGVGGTYLYTLLPTMDPSIGPVTPDGLYNFLGQISSLFIAIAALVLSYKAVAGETESGSVKLLLGLPHTRRDVFLGKVLGRSGVMIVALLIGLLSTFGVAIALIDGVAAGAFVGFLAVTLLFGIVYVTIMVSLSATTKSTGTAATLAIGAFVVLELFWDAVVFAVTFVGNGFAVPTAGLPSWALAFNGFAPSIAYQTAVGWLLGWLSGASMTVPYHQTVWFGLVVLVAWAVFPAVIGYARYNRADL